MANRREFLREVAARRGFDPLVAENWYNLTKENIMHHKVIQFSRLLLHCELKFIKGSFVALESLWRPSECYYEFVPRDWLART